MIVAKSNLEVAIKASLHAGKEIIRIYNDTKADLELELKTDDSPLTVADRNPLRGTQRLDAFLDG